MANYRVVEKWTRGKDEKPEKYYVVEEYRDVVVQEEEKDFREVCFEIEKTFFWGTKYKTWDKERRYIVVNEEVREKQWAEVEEKYKHGKFGNIDIIGQRSVTFKTRIQACKKKAELEKKDREREKNLATPLPEDKVVTCK